MPNSAFKDQFGRHRDLVKQTSDALLQHLLKDTATLTTDRLETVLNVILLQLSRGGRPQSLDAVYRHIIYPLLVRKMSMAEAYDLIYQRVMMPLLRETRWQTPEEAPEEDVSEEEAPEEVTAEEEVPHPVSGTQPTAKGQMIPSVTPQRATSAPAEIIGLTKGLLEAVISEETRDSPEMPAMPTPRPELDQERRTS